ncbi:hypothetical protein N9L26_02435 [Candidatus Pacebacteria bacterium]|nr:hypothetical protein [Candidatus Paceibacterota bacterium]
MSYIPITGVRAMSLVIAVLLLTLSASTALAQVTEPATSSATSTASTSAAAGSTTQEILTQRLIENPEAPRDITQPEQIDEKVEIINLLQSRSADEPTLFNFFAYWVQQAIFLGIPANTIVLILLIPVLATIVAFVRVVLGFQTLELLVPIALSFAFVAVGVTLGLIILLAVVVASYLSRILLRRITIMHFPKRAFSMTLLSFFVFAALTVSAGFELTEIQNVSIFPVLILTLLGDSVVSIQLYKSLQETISITVVTVAIGLLGYVLATSQMVLQTLVLYPELILLTLPANLLIGRYIGLRLTEYFRFEQVK